MSSWSLTFDREQRHHRRPPSYSEKNMSDDENSSISRKKRGRPKSNGQETTSEIQPGQRRRGRPPKYPRPPVQENVKNPSKMKGKPVLNVKKNTQHKNISDYDDGYYIEYAYEYEYEYSEVEKTDNGKKGNNGSQVKFDKNNQASVKEEKLQMASPNVKKETENDNKSGTPTKTQQSPTRTNKKNAKGKNKMLSDSFGKKDDSDNLSVQEIIGKYDPFVVKPNHPAQYFVKFHNKSYLHCKWLTHSELSKLDSGEFIYKKFLQKSDSNKLVHSLSIPSLLMIQGAEISTQWFEVDRIFKEIPGQNEQDSKYYVKWKEMDYENFSIESPEDFQNSEAISLYKKRLSHYNPKHIPSKWVRPTIDQKKEVTERPVSKNGLVFKDFQMEGLNWLIKCWYEHRNNIFGDESRFGKLPQLIQMLVFLSKQYSINGPFLILVSPNQIPIWKQTIEEWSDFNTVVFSGTASSRQLTVENEMDVKDSNGRALQDYIKADIVLTSYDLFLNFSQQFFEIEWRYLIADDGFKMRNSKGKIRNLIKQLSYEHITLNMEWEMMKQNNIYKIFFLMNFIDPKVFGNFNEFSASYIPYEGENVEKLKKVVFQYFLSRESEEINQLTKSKDYIIILVEPSMIQRNGYIEAVKKRTDILMKPITDEADIPLIQLITTLRRLVNHPLLFCSYSSSFTNPDSKNNSHNIYSNEHSISSPNDFPFDIKEELRKCRDPFVDSCGKMKFISEFIPWAINNNHRTMIFSQPVRIIDLLEEFMKINGYKYERIDCMTSADKRQSIINSYIENKIPIMLFSSKPGSFQIDLNLFDEVIVYENDSYYFPDEMKGTLYYLITNGSYEMNRITIDTANVITCFDEEPLQYCSHADFRLIDAEDIEVMLRDSIRLLFEENTAERINGFFSKNIDQIMETCQHHGDVAAREAEVGSLNKQKSFWNEMLKPSPQSKDREVTGVPDTVQRVKQLLNSLIDRGYSFDDEDQLDLIKFALTLTPPESSKTLAIMNEIVGDNSSDIPVRRFGPTAFLIEKLASKLFDSVVFFARLRRILFYAAKPEVKWPLVQPIWKESSVEYGLMYYLSKTGWKQLPSAFEESKELKQKQIEKRISSIIDDIEKQFSVSGWTQNDAELVTPEDWVATHNSVLPEEDIDKIFTTIYNFGLPLIRDNSSIDISKLMEMSSVSDSVSYSAVEICITDILGFSLSIQDETSKQNFDPYPAASKLENKHTNQEYIDLITVCRFMEKIHSFFNDYETKINDPSSEIFHNLIFNNGFDKRTANKLLICLKKYGPHNTEAYSNEKFEITEPVCTFEKRLRIAGSIIDQIRSKNNIIIASNSLKIVNFGQIIDSPNFRNKNYPYPVGYSSYRLLVKNIEGVPQVWFKCEIQAVGMNPIFIVSILEEPQKEFIDITPFDAWKRIIGSFIGTDAAVEALTNLKQTGEWLYGLTHPNVIETLRNKARERGIKLPNEESSDADSDADYRPTD